MIALVSPAMSSLWLILPDSLLIGRASTLSVLRDKSSDVQSEGAAPKAVDFHSKGFTVMLAGPRML